MNKTKGEINMSKYRAILIYPDGYEEESMSDYDTYAEAESEGERMVDDYYSSIAVGAEVLHLSDPDEYPDEEYDFDKSDEPKVKIIKVN